MVNSEQLKIRLDEIGAPSDVKALAAELSDLALRDSLTGLYNRRFFDEALTQQTESARRYGRNLSLILFDLDNLKKINDIDGHGAGDQAVQTFARILSKTARKADIVCRIGGDEFAALLFETSAAAACTFSARFFQALETAGIQASCGIAALPAKNLFTDADSELLKAKKKKHELPHEKDRL